MRSARREMRPDRLEDGAAGEHEIGALVADAGVGGALGVAHGAQRRDRRVDLGAASHRPSTGAAVVARQVEMHAGDRRHRPGGAEQMEARAARLVRRPARRRRRAPRRHGAVIAAKTSSLTSTPPNVSASETTPSRSDSQASTRRARARRAAVAPSQTISDEPPPMSNMHGRLRRSASASSPTPGGGEMRLGLAVDDFEVDAEPLAHALRRNRRRWSAERQASVAISARARDAARAHLVAADAQAPRACARSRPRSGARSATSPRRAARCAKTRR